MRTAISFCLFNLEKNAFKSFAFKKAVLWHLVVVASLIFSLLTLFGANALAGPLTKDKPIVVHWVFGNESGRYEDQNAFRYRFARRIFQSIESDQRLHNADSVFIIGSMPEDEMRTLVEPLFGSHASVLRFDDTQAIKQILNSSSVEYSDVSLFGGAEKALFESLSVIRSFENSNWSLNIELLEPDLNFEKSEFRAAEILAYFFTVRRASILSGVRWSISNSRGPIKQRHYKKSLQFSSYYRVLRHIGEILNTIDYGVLGRPRSAKTEAEASGEYKFLRVLAQLGNIFNNSDSSKFNSNISNLLRTYGAIEDDSQLLCSQLF